MKYDVSFHLLKYKFAPGRWNMDICAVQSKKELSEHVRHNSIDLLNCYLSGILDLGVQVKFAHWNVKAPTFTALHDLFDKVLRNIEELTEKIAGRCIALGGIVTGEVNSVVSISNLSKFSPDFRNINHQLLIICDGLAQFGQSVSRAIVEVSGFGDTGTTDLLVQVFRNIEQLLWQVESYLYQPASFSYPQTINACTC
ncbi:ferritin-like domain-containing protein [Microbulbifer bruguierae]|uniref:Ferritin-like domain-containing protein n=1 Tax=Microbulbifer bruguierae TaxID=3029061 RepID=A0ABY8NDW1_9GAMM|nr:ferritin-like domain-containing protein [Microbulbifer bruguierae]WGL17091.1 ferritin-like domain-containing protein [Microbulbifer bruguierae]